jgi:chromosome partitioning protein
MKIVALISQKGGVGKTTLTTALAVEASRQGQQVVVFDLDPQASASFWQDTRQEMSRETAQKGPSSLSDKGAPHACGEIAVTATPAARLPHLIEAARKAGCDLVLIDTPPFAKDIAYEAAQLADIVLIPSRPAVLDIMAMCKTVELVKHHRKPFSVVLTFCPPQGKEVEDAVQVIAQLGAPLCPVRMGQRIAYSRAQQTGQSAQEIDAEGKAAAEMKQLYTYICRNVYTHTDIHSHQETAYARSSSL